MLKQLLEEIKTAQGTNSMKELISLGYLPLSHDMMDRLGYSYDIDEAYSVTNSHYLKNIVKIQNTKKQISSFTKGGHELAKLPSNPNILLKLSGNVVIEAASDAWTLVDTQGRRWIVLASKSSENGTEYSEKLSFFIKGIRDKIIKQLGYENINDHTIYDMTKTDRAKLYKLYIENIEKYLEKDGYKLLNKHLKTNITYSYNELILNQFKIEGVYAIDHDYPNLKEEVESFKLNYLGVKTMKEIIKINV